MTESLAMKRIVERGLPKVSLRMIFFNWFFAFAMLSIHLFQLFVLPLAISPISKPMYDRLINYSKAQYGLLIVFITQTFAPTRLVITAQDAALSDLVTHSADGTVQLNLPERSVFLSNHQIYNDWLYIWTLLYLANIQDSIIIILKATLKWVPLIGPAMQMFRFIFLARSWDADRKTLEKSLAKMGHRADRHQDPLTLLIFPEGTLLSPDTKPKSAAYAQKLGISDTKYNLLPRSTGLLFCLRALSQHVSDLQLVDITIAYAGVRPWPEGYGQQYYTLQSVYGHGDAPPAVHIHYRSTLVSSIPIGRIPEKRHISQGMPEPTTEEKAVFEQWLIQRWQEKDDLLEQFYKTGSFSGSSQQIPVRVKNPAELLVLLGILAFGFLVCLEGCRSFTLHALTALHKLFA